VAAHERLGLILSAINERLRAQLARLMEAGPKSEAERRMIAELQA
jgi:hypothetical protein